MSGNGDTPPELLRALGRPIRLFDIAVEEDADNLDGGRMVIFDWREGSLGRALRLLVRSSREE
jgi:hypothetical protein